MITQQPEAIGDLWAIFAIFHNKINAFCAYFDQNSYVKAIIHQLKAFEKQSKLTK